MNTNFKPNDRRPLRRALAPLTASALALLAASSAGCSGGEPTRDAPVPAADASHAKFASVHGDFDGDGWIDLAVGATGDDLRAEVGAGRVFVRFGGPGKARSQLLAPPAGLTDNAAASFGAELAAGDFDRDGRDDLAVVVATAPDAIRPETTEAVVFTGGSAALQVPANAAPTSIRLPSARPPVASDSLAPLARRNDAIPFAEMTPLQKHAAFFDYDGDGWITVPETYRGCRDLGIGVVASAGLAVAINAALALPTSRTLLNPTLEIRIRDIDRGKHGSDSDIYDTEGNFVPERFEQFFAVWDRNRDGGLDLAELAARLYEERDVWDFVGVTASGGEFGLLWLIAQENGKISKDRMRRQYDGTLFYEIAAGRGRRPVLF